MRLTPISDTRTYQSRQFLSAVAAAQEAGIDFSLTMQPFATRLTGLIGGAFGSVLAGSPIFINIGFQSIAFVGLVALLRAVEGQLRKTLLALFMLPSFTVWSSIATKEALLVFLLGILCAHIVRMYYNTDQLRWYHFVCVSLLFTFKPHYVIPLVLLVGVTYAGRYVRQKATVALVAFIGTLVMLYLFRDQVDDLAQWTDHVLVAMGGRSGRLLFLVEPYDTFWKAPYGMYLAFVGPTFGEAGKGVLHLASFLESSLILAVLLFYLIKRLPELPAYNVILALGTTFWVLFPNYPLGVSNPGTAVRYRTGYLVLIFLAFVFLLSRERYVNWCDGLRDRRLGRLRGVGLQKGGAALRPVEGK